MWSGTSPLLHVSFTLEHTGHVSAREAPAFSARIQVYQRCSQSRRQVLRISSADTNSQVRLGFTCTSTTRLKVASKQNRGGSAVAR